jgi:hypothetical protein
MPLQNRVTPFGEIIAASERGLFTGNRGIIHDPATRTLLTGRWATKTWLVCTCDYKGVRRNVMSCRSWTELFFLDEATALESDRYLISPYEPQPILLQHKHLQRQQGMDARAQADNRLPQLDSHSRWRECDTSSRVYQGSLIPRLRREKNYPT